MIPFWWTGAAGGNDAGELAAWFLRTGVWDNAGQWVDAVSWPGASPTWFLSTGAWNLLGLWDDSRGWP